MMSYRSTKLIILLLSFLIGIFIAKDLLVSWKAVFFLVGLLAIFSLIFNKTKLLYVGLSLMFLGLGISYYWFYSQRIIRPIHIGEKEFQAIILSDPAKQGSSQKFIIQSDSGKLLISTRLFPEYSYGDKLKVSGEVKQPGMIGDFDYAQYLERYGVSAVMYFPEIEKISSNNGSVLYSWLIKSNHLFVNSLSKSIQDPESSLLSAILVGARKALPQELTDNFKKAGLTHIIAISGYNVTIVIMVVWWLLRYLGRKWAFWGSAVLVMSFIVFTGASASVIRGGLVAMLAITARSVGRKTNPNLIIAISATLMVLGNALILRDDVGFVLSFLAFAGLVYLSPLLQTLFNRRGKPMLIKNILAETLSAQIFVLPILMNKFGTVSLVSPLANIMILPIIPLIMLVGFVQGVIGLFLGTLSEIIGWFNWILLHYIIKAAELMARIPYASINSELSIFWYAPYYLSLFAIIVLIRRKIEKNKNS